MSPFRFGAAAAAAALFAAAGPSWAQSNPGYFVPPQQRTAPATGPRTTPRPAVRQSQPTVQPQIQPPDQGPAIAQEDQGPPMQLQLPPMPTLPSLAKGAAPPTAVIGVIGIPEIMRASSAAQQVEKLIGERREKLNQDAQKEQLAWRDMQQGLANDRGKLSPEQIRQREKELQDRITSAQKTFRDRNRVIQEAGQYGLAQIERVLVAVIRQVAESRGMNLVLHRAQVALNVNEFDLTEQVAEQLNKVLPSVNLPADGVRPPMVEVKPETGAPAPATVSAPAGDGKPEGATPPKK